MGVFIGDAVEGPLEIVDVAGLGLPGVKVINVYNAGDYRPTYIRTSPIVAVLDKTETSLTFRTEGGVYLLERVLEN